MREDNVMQHPVIYRLDFGARKQRSIDLPLESPAVPRGLFQQGHARRGKRPSSDPASMRRGAGSGKPGYLSYVKAVAVFALVFQATLSAFALPAPEGAAALLPLWLFHGMAWGFPCFLMVYGAELLDPFQEIGIGHIFGRYISRLVWSLLLCGFLYRGFDLLASGEGFSLYKLMYGFYEIFTGTGWAQLRYVYVLLSIFLLLPFYRMVARMCGGREFQYFLFLQFFFLSLLPLLRFFSLETGLYIQILSIHPFYFFLGHVIHRGFLQFRPLLAALLFFLGAGLMLLFLGIWQRTGMDGFLLFCGESAFPAILQAMGLFSLFESLDESGEDALFLDARAAGRRRKQSLWQRAWLSLDRCAYGISLLHILLIRLFLYGAAYFHIEARFQGTGIAFLLAVCFFALSWLLLALINILFKW